MEVFVCSYKCVCVCESFTRVGKTYRILSVEDFSCEYRDTGIQGYRDTGIQGYRDTGIQGYRDTGIQGYRNKRIQ